MTELIQLLQEKVKLLQNASPLEKITKGYSSDTKYVFTLDENKFLLRVSDMQRYVKKKAEFKLLKDMRHLNVNVPKPIEIGSVEEQNSCYTVYSYMEGIDAKEAIHTLTEEEQYNLGVEAGVQLSKMHLYEAPCSINSWYERVMEKHYRYLAAYKSSGIKIKNDERIIDFIEMHKHVLKNRSNRFQHDDFHLENIIVKDKKYAGVIDFDNFDWGDPLHDFVKVALFQREISVPFSIGQIEGYFDDQVPDDFWLLYSIYSGMVIFSSVVWSSRFAPEQLEQMIMRLYTLLEDHKYFEMQIPKWYESNKF
ncbi:aminoglycoside phosphotransferase family protein [Sutcliffiella halmapala]|uniref:aminoglycoside phosphotransferase family protein n=1 Tax=Sutcliffiella halmapala TaxID=79882 RepID=UPI000995126B|nr:aminoglycoside phosphotransferase family protein [Sutcliffiella halmapala]